MDPKQIECDVRLDLPYPPIRTECRRMDYACAMLGNVGGCNSEMTAVGLYFYNSVMLGQEHGDLAQCYHKISVVEMHHLDIFASLARQMGLDPRLWEVKNQRTFYWSPTYIQYPRGLREIIDISIQGEAAAIQKYTRQAETIQDENIVEILNRIILDERHHLELFHTMLDHIS